MTDFAALEAAILIHADEDVPRLAFADYLEVNAGETVQCERCEGSGSHRYFPDIDGKPNYSDSAPCVACNGSCFRSLHNGERAELIRVGVELAGMGDRVLFGKDEMAVPWLEMNSCGPDFWTFHAGGKTAKVGDRIDVYGLPCNRSGTRIGNAKMYHGLIVRRVEDHGSDGILHAVARDANSKPWEGKTLRTRERELIAFGCTAGWWDVPELDGPHGTYTDGEIWWWYTVKEECIRVNSTVRRGYIDELRLPAAEFTKELALAVFTRFPVTSVVLTDADTHLSIDDRGDRGGGCFWRVDTLPFHLWERMAGGIPGSRIAKVFDTRELAIAALNAACVTWGRSLANQPPLI